MKLRTIIIGLVLIALAIFFLLKPYYPKYVLMNEGILSKLGLDGKCTYLPPSKFMGTRDPGFECQTGFYDKEGQRAEIERMGKILTDNEWIRTDKIYGDAFSVSYKKGDKFTMTIETYDWGPGTVESNKTKLLVIYGMKYY